MLSQLTWRDLRCSVQQMRPEQHGRQRHEQLQQQRLQQRRQRQHDRLLP